MRNRTYGGVRGRKVSLPCGKLTFLLLDCHRLAVIRKKIFHLEQPQASGTREAQMELRAAPYPYSKMCNVCNVCNVLQTLLHCL